MTSPSPDQHSYLDGWRARAEAAAARDAAWRLAVRQRLCLAVDALAAMGASRVVLFGSLVCDEAGPGSDVDLWVEGLAESLWLDAVVVVSRVLGDIDADVVRSESASESLRNRVVREGLVLLEPR